MGVSWGAPAVYSSGVLALLELPAWLFHPLYGRGYQFWSGIGSDLGEISLLTGAFLIYRRHQCHVRRCWRLQWKEHEGHMLCRRHHPVDAPAASDFD